MARALIWLVLFALVLPLFLLLAASLSFLLATTSSEPDVSWSPATTIPPVSLASEWRTKIPANSIAFTSGASKILTLSAWGGLLTIQNAKGSVEQQNELPVPYTFHLVVNPQQIIMLGENQTIVAFRVVDIRSAETVFWERLPSAIKPGLAQASIHFALSPDHSMLAVAYGGFVPGQPISLYDTNNWHKISTIELPPTARSGIGLMAFSGDGRRLAFSSRDHVMVVDAPGGQLIGTIPARAGSIALTHDGSILAVEGSDATNGPFAIPTGIRVFRVSDGAEIAGHAASKVGPNCPEDPSDCGLNRPVLWDPRSRFLVFPDGYHAVRIWNPFGSTNRDVVIRTRYFGGGIALSSDGTRLAITDGVNPGFVSLFRIGD